MPGKAGKGFSPFVNIDQRGASKSVKSGAGDLHGWFLYNASAAALYVKLYNKTGADGVVNAGTDIPYMVIALPAGAGANQITETGIPFPLGIQVRACTGVGNTDATDPTANQAVVQLFYQ